MKEPAKIRIEVEGGSVAAGAAANVVLQLEPKSGVKINKYPRITLKVAEHDGLSAGAEGSAGADAPPPPDRMDDNYFPKDGIAPVRLELPIAADATPGSYEVEGQLKFFYCVSASGFCAPSKQTVSIPVTIK